MAGVYPWLVLAASMLALILMSYILYHYFTDPSESYLVAVLAVVLSLTNSILCTLLIPVDIYVISEGNITSESLHVTISQDYMRTAYLFLFSALLFMAFCLVPYAYFYGEDRREVDFDDKLDKVGSRGCVSALKSTTFFIGFVMVLLVIGLNFRPGHTESLDKAMGSQQDAVRWAGDLLDVEHGGLNAISFSIACLTLLGVCGWVFYTAYGMAALPFDWLRGKQSASEQRADLEENIASIRDKYRLIQTKYAAREDGSLDLSRMKAADRKELNRLQREHKSLMQHNYRLQEIEQKAGAVIPQLLQCLVPFRWMIGISMMFISLLVVSSLLLTLLDRLLHSNCGMSCGYTLKERLIFNPLDEIFLRLAKFFPVDFIILAVLVLYIFIASVFGIISLGIRCCCFNMYALRARKSMPQATLLLCNVMAFILLALCMALLTIAPNYTSFGSQRAVEDGAEGSRCSLDKDTGDSPCMVSVISAFFTRIAVAMPVFSVAYYFANWAFIVVFCTIFTRCLLCNSRQPFLEAVNECSEEELGLLNFT